MDITLTALYDVESFWLYFQYVEGSRRRVGFRKHVERFGYGLFEKAYEFEIAIDNDSSIVQLVVP
jgi:hypothetical protein